MHVDKFNLLNQPRPINKTNINFNYPIHYNNIHLGILKSSDLFLSFQKVFNFDEVEVPGQIAPEAADERKMRAAVS